MGLSSSKQKTSSTSTGNATTTPQAPSWLEGPVSNYYGQVGNLLNNNATPTQRPASQLQNQAFAGASGLGGFNQALSDAMGGTRGLMDFQPGSVEAQQLSQTDLNPYMNQFQGDVIDSLLGDFSHANDLGLNSLRSMTPNGAYGGSRQAVSAGQLVGDNTRTLTGQLANLRSQNFNQAQQGAQFDISNRLGADQFNVNSGLQGAQFRGNMANQLTQQGLGGDANSRANLGLQATLGDQQREIDYQNDPTQQRLQQLAQLQQLLGINGGNFIGQNVQSTGTQTGSSTQSNSPWGALLSGLGTLWGGG